MSEDQVHTMPARRCALLSSSGGAPWRGLALQHSCGPSAHVHSVGRADTMRLDLAACGG